MIGRIIDWCAADRFLVFTGAVALTLWGIWAMTRTPVDAVPDISDVQVIVSTEWMGRSPDLIEDQITYPVVTALLSTPRVRTVRGFTASASRTSTSSSKTARTCTGRAAASSSTCRGFAGTCRTA